MTGFGAVMHPHRYRVALGIMIVSVLLPGLARAEHPACENLRTKLQQIELELKTAVSPAKAGAMAEAKQKVRVKMRQLRCALPRG